MSQQLKNFKTYSAVLDHYLNKISPCLLSVLLFCTGCIEKKSNCQILNRLGDIEICTVSSCTSRYSYVIFCQDNEYDTIQIYKAESNQIILFNKDEVFDTLFICDRWNNAHICSHNIPIAKVEFDDSTYFDCSGKSIHELRPEFIQICIPKIEDILDCHEK